MNFILPALLCTVAQLVAIPLVPIAVWAERDGRLPWWAWWLETHDNLGWAGPLSEGYPATRWGLVRWLWRNRAYALRNEFRARVTADTERRQSGDVIPARIGVSRWHGRIGSAWEREWSLGVWAFRVYVRAGWKLRPYFAGHVPTGPTATGMLIPVSVRIDDFDE